MAEPPSKKQRPGDEMQLYNDLDVVWGKLEQLGYPRSSAEIPFAAIDTATSLSYITDQELAEAGEFLLKGRKPESSNILEVGCGLARPLRAICHKTSCKGTGTEYISPYVSHANELSQKCGMSDVLKVHQGDIINGTTNPKVEHKCDGMVCILCIVHLPGSKRDDVWRNIASSLKPGSGIFLHDFYAKAKLSEETKAELGKQGLAPDLPSKEEYVATLERQGFKDISFEDVTEVWSSRVAERHKTFAASKDAFLKETKLQEKTYESLLQFYTFVITHVLPKGGASNVGGVVIKGRLSD